MKKSFLMMVFAAVLSLAFCSCVNINSFNKDREDEEIDALDFGDSVKTELYFGQQKPDEAILSDADWQNFLDKSISPLFPDGFTVVDAFGQCKDASGKIIRGKTKMLIVVRSDDDDDLVFDKVEEEFAKIFPGNAFFKVSYQVSSSLDDEEDDDDGDDAD